MGDDQPYTADHRQQVAELLEDRIESLGMSYDAAAGELLDQLTGDGWLPAKEAKKLRAMKRMAERHAHEYDRDIAAAEAQVLELKAQIQRHLARDAQRHVDAIDRPPGCACPSAGLMVQPGCPAHAYRGGTDEH